MKNIRKIVAILAAALMLCSVLPMSAFAAPGDVALSANFDNGLDGFTSDVSLSNDGGYLTFNAPGASWVTAYAYANGIKANTMYEVTFKAKADKDGQLGVQIGNGWSGRVFREFVDVTTEWQEYTVSMSDLALTEAALFQFLSNYDASVAPIFYIDDLCVVEVMDPALIGKVINGDFETGDATGWNLPQVGSVKAEAAHDGSYGINVKGNGGWGGMLDQTIPVNAGKAYEISLWVKVNATGINLQIKDGTTSGANIAGEWIEMAKATEWTQFTYIVRPTQDQLTINFCGSGSAAEDVYVDSIVITELKDPSFDGYITNGDFEVGDLQSWDPVWWAGNISLIEGGHNSDYAMLTNQGQWQLVRQKVSVKPNTNYVVSVYAKNAHDMTLLVKDGNDIDNLKQAGITAGDEWTKVSLEFNSGNWSEVYVGVMGNVAGATAIVDDFFMFEKVEASNDGYLINGTFETGDIAPWNNLWGSCPKAEVVKGGKDDNFSLDIVSGLWKHVRQMPIAVEPNTDYKVSVWAKNSSGISLLVKGLADDKSTETRDIKNVNLDAGDEWAQFTNEFNSGDHNYIIVSFMGNNDNCYGSFDNIVMEKVVAECEHEYDNACDVDCNLCYETREVTHNVVHVEAVASTCTAMGNIEYWYCDVCGAAWLDAECTLNTNLKAVVLPMAEHTYENCLDADCDVCGATREPGHNMTHNPAKDAVDCANPGNIENWYCSACGEYFADEFGNQILNPWFIQITVDCVKPEGLADCASWTCETCGNENFGTGEHDVLICQGGICSKCNAEIAGVGCQNYDTPACEDGVCYYCGGFVPGFGHENGAVAPCVDGECAYGCGLTYPATEDHVDADGDDYCDNCWNHLACIDEDGDNHCDVCWSTMPHDCIDEDADGFCDICWTEMPVEPDDEILYGDANGDGEITLMDATLLSQYLSGYDVEVDLVTGDANGDGEITLMDATLLSQYLSGYDVILGPAEV